MRTNIEVAETLGIHMTMASRLRTGSRLPSARLLIRIGKTYGIPDAELNAAYGQGPKAFAKLLHDRVFTKPEPDTAVA